MEMKYLLIILALLCGCANPTPIEYENLNEAYDYCIQKYCEILIHPDSKARTDYCGKNEQLYQKCMKDSLIPKEREEL